MRKPIIGTVSSIVVILVIALAMIAVLFARENKPVVYFEATRDSNETIGEVFQLY